MQTTKYKDEGQELEEKVRTWRIKKQGRMKNEVFIEWKEQKEKYTWENVKKI